jgi:hypothetical protein
VPSADQFLAHDSTAWTADGKVARGLFNNGVAEQRPFTSGTSLEPTGAGGTVREALENSVYGAIDAPPHGARERAGEVDAEDAVEKRSPEPRSRRAGVHSGGRRPIRPSPRLRKRRDASQARRWQARSVPARNPAHSRCRRYSRAASRALPGTNNPWTGGRPPVVPAPSSTAPSRCAGRGVVSRVVRLTRA